MSEETNPDTLALHPDLVFRAAGDEGVAVDQRKSEILVVNGLGLRVMQLVRAHGSRQAVLTALLAEYEAPAERIAADLDAFLDEMRQRDLLC
ncbi:PqqD family protein [uncultured Thiodictyon sp.]|uniref:PqqD family protein n=1 Tax=uncultured Thiodictyon sp. TaxID=1846217 RepID=UPI0025F8B900|nr:PqqD family protein [uncultured Thiodictyon sp.]